VFVVTEDIDRYYNLGFCIAFVQNVFKIYSLFPPIIFGNI
jgi:hypothetical protein